MTNTAEEPFAFFTERRLVVLTGRRACKLDDLVKHLAEVNGSCVFYHTHYLYLTHHFERPRFYNEFALWVSQALQEERLAERLAAIDLLSITSIREMREALLETIRKHIAAHPENHRECPPGNEFHFCEAKSFIMPTGLVADTVPDFFDRLEEVTNSCLHFHFFEARLRLQRPTNDFSEWLRLRGETRLARSIDRLNPYSVTLDELKQEIVRLGRRRRTN
jgi:hypothetical protein